MNPREFEQCDVWIELLEDNPVYPHQRLEPTENQPDDDGTPVGSLKELEEIVRKTKFMAPLTVVRLGERYTVLDGHRRLRVARAIGVDAVSCQILTLRRGETVENLFISLGRTRGALRATWDAWRVWQTPQRLNRRYAPRPHPSGTAARPTAKTV